MNKLVHLMYCKVNHFNYDAYWKMRACVVDADNKTNIILKCWYLYRCKKMEAYAGASLGTYLNYGSKFASPPSLPHGLRGIFVSDKAVVGANVTLYQQSCIGIAGGWAK